MPQSSRILAPVNDALIAHMISNPLIREHLFDLGDEAGFETPPLGLLVSHRILSAGRQAL